MSDRRARTKLLLNLMGAPPLPALLPQNLCHRLLWKALTAQVTEVQASVISVGQMCLVVAFSFISRGVNNIFLH